MPKIKLPDLTDVDDVQEFQPCPKGLFIFRIKEVREGETGSTSNFPGQPMGTVILEPVREVGGKKIKPGTFSNVWHRFPLDDQNAGWTPRLKEFVVAVGGKLKGWTLDPDKLEGVLIQGKVRHGKDQNQEVRAEIDRLMPADASEPDDADVDDDDGAEGDDELWTQEELEELDNDDLKEAATELEVDVPKRMTAAGKKKLIAAILAAQEDDEDDDDDDSDDDDESEAYDEDDLKAMDKDELKEVAGELEVTFPKKWSAAAKKKVIALIMEAQESEDDDDDDDDDDEAEDGYDDMSKTELVKEARSRKLKVKKGAGADDIVAMLRENDAEDGDDDDDDDDGDDDDESVDPDDLDFGELKTALKERGLSTKGSEKVLRARLVKALEADDDGDPF